LAFVELSGGAVGGHDVHVQAVHACTHEALDLLRNIGLACQAVHVLPPCVPHVTFVPSHVLPPCVPHMMPSHVLPPCVPHMTIKQLAKQTHGSADALVWEATTLRTPFSCQLACAGQQR